MSLVFIRKRLGKGDGFGVGMAAVVGDYAPGTVPFEHPDVRDETVVDRDEGPRSAALSRPVDDQFVGRQARQCATDRLEVVAASTGRGDQFDDLGQAHAVVGDLAPAAQQLEHGGQDVATGTTKPQLRGVGLHPLAHLRGVGKFAPAAASGKRSSGVSVPATRP